MRRISSVLSVCLFSGAAFAATDPQGIAVGGASLIPTIEIQHQHDDNIFSSDVNQEESSITNLKPRLEYYAERDAENYLSVSYDGDYAKYWQSDDDDYDDHTLSIMGAYSGNDFFRLTADASTAKLHDNRGEGASEGAAVTASGDPDEYDQDIAGIAFDFGREDARLGANLSLRTVGIEYTNNRAVTAFRDRDDTTFEGRIIGKLTGKTNAFVGYRNTDIEYDSLTVSGDTLDSDESTVLVGLEWEATGKTTGTIEIGRLEKDFDSPLVGEEDLTVWGVGVQWSPRSYSVISFNSSKDAAETNGTGAYIEQINHSVSWMHDWSERLHSTFTVSVGDDEYPGSARQDDRDNFSIGLDYDWQRWANIGLTLEHSERDSNDDLFDFDRRRIIMSLDLSL